MLESSRHGRRRLSAHLESVSDRLLLLSMCSSEAMESSSERRSYSKPGYTPEPGYGSKLGCDPGCEVFLWTWLFFQIQ